MVAHNFKEVFRGENSIAFSRNEKYINLNYPFDREEISFPRFSFNDQINWLWSKFFKAEKESGINNWIFSMDFQEIFAELYSKCLIRSVLVSKSNGEILYCSKDWIVKPEELKAIIYDWKHHAKSIKFNNEKFAMLNSSGDYFSAVNYKDKTYLVGASTPDLNGEKLLIIGHTPVGVDAKQSYVEIVRIANHMKDNGSFISPSLIGLSGSKISLLKEEYEALIDLEKLLAKNIPMVSKVDYKSFGFVTHEKHIIAIALNRKGLKVIPDSFWNLNSLHTLYLCDNQLESIPNAIEKLISLKELNLATNKLKTLPETLGNLKNLQILDLRYNKLKSLPESIGQLSNLKILNLINNQLSSLPDSIGHLSSLQILNVCGNWLKNFPESITNLSGLKEFSMSANELTHSDSIKLFLKQLETKGCLIDNQEDKPILIKHIVPNECPNTPEIIKTLKQVLAKSNLEKNNGVILEFRPSVANIIPFYENSLIETNIICLDLTDQVISNKIKYHILYDQFVNDNETESTISDAIRNVVRNCDVKIRRELYNNVSIIGDKDLIKQPDFKAELYKEIKKLIPESVTLRINQM